MNNVINCLNFLELNLAPRKGGYTVGGLNEAECALDEAKQDYLDGGGRWSPAVMLILKLYASLQPDKDYEFSYDGFYAKYNINVKNLRSVISLWKNVGLVNLRNEVMVFGKRRFKKSFIRLKQLPDSRRQVSDLAKLRIVELLADSSVKVRNLRGVQKDRQSKVTQEWGKHPESRKIHDLKHDAYLFLIAILYFSDSFFVTRGVSYNAMEKMFGIKLPYCKQIVSRLKELGYLSRCVSGLAAKGCFGPIKNTYFINQSCDLWKEQSRVFWSFAEKPNLKHGLAITDVFETGVSITDKVLRLKIKNHEELQEFLQNAFSCEDNLAVSLKANNLKQVLNLFCVQHFEMLQDNELDFINKEFLLAFFDLGRYLVKISGVSVSVLNENIANHYFLLWRNHHEILNCYVANKILGSEWDSLSSYFAENVINQSIDAQDDKDKETLEISAAGAELLDRICGLALKLLDKESNNNSFINFTDSEMTDRYQKVMAYCVLLRVLHVGRVIFRQEKQLTKFKCNITMLSIWDDYNYYEYRPKTTFSSKLTVDILSE